MILRSILSSTLRRAIISAIRSDNLVSSAGISEIFGAGVIVGFSSRILRNANIRSPGSWERIYRSASIFPA